MRFRNILDGCTILVGFKFWFKFWETELLSLLRWTKLWTCRYRLEILFFYITYLSTTPSWNVDISNISLPAMGLDLRPDSIITLTAWSMSVIQSNLFRVKPPPLSYNLFCGRSCKYVNDNLVLKRPSRDECTSFCMLHCKEIYWFDWFVYPCIGALNYFICLINDIGRLLTVYSSIKLLMVSYSIWSPDS